MTLLISSNLISCIIISHKSELYAACGPQKLRVRSALEYIFLLILFLVHGSQDGAGATLRAEERQAVISGRLQ
jgi:hypothetical protein